MPFKNGATSVTTFFAFFFLEFVNFRSYLTVFFGWILFTEFAEIKRRYNFLSLTGG